MGEAKLCGKSGGLNLNGVDEKMYVYQGETINSGDFVEFIRGVASSTKANADPHKLGLNTWSFEMLEATKLTDTKVFVTYGYYVSSTEYNLYGVVLTLNKTAITVGNPVLLDTNRDKPYYISVVSLTDSKVFITYTGGTAVNLRAIVCTISGTAITHGTAVSLATYTQSGYHTVATRLSDSKVLVTHQYERDEETLRGMVCTISGTTITAGTDVEVVASTYANVHSPTLISDNKVFIAHHYSNSYYMYGTVVVIDGTTVTKGTTVQVSTYQTASTVRALKVNDMVFVTQLNYNSTDSNYYFYGEVCTVDGTTITVNVPTTKLLTDGYPRSLYGYALLNVYPTNHVALFHSFIGNDDIYAKMLEISTSAITLNTAVFHSTYETTPLEKHLVGINLTDEVFLIFYSCEDSADTNNTYQQRAELFGVQSDYKRIVTNVVWRTYETQVRKTTTDEFNGIAKTKGTGGTATAHSGSVKVSSFSPFEKTKTGTAPIVVDNVLADLPANLSLQGNTIQPNIRSGKNILPQENFTTAQTISGVTFTPNADGSVKISGTSTAAIRLDLTYKLLNELVVGKTYISSIGQTVSGVRVIVEEDKGGNWAATVSGGINTAWVFNGLTAGDKVRAAISVSSGKTVDTTIYPQIEEGSTVTSYEPYGATPSPNYPSELYSVQGKSDNLFDSDDALITKAGFTKQSDGSYYLASPKVISSVWENTEGYAGQMTFTGECKWEKDINGRGMVFIVHYTDGTSKDFMTNSGVWNNKWGNFKLITEKGKTVKKIAMKWGTGRSSYFRNVMLNKGIVALSYQPYGYSNVVVKIQGKNYVREIYNGSNLSVVNGVCTQTATDTKTNMQWKVQKRMNGTNVAQIRIWDDNSLGVKSATFTKDSTFNQIYFGYNGSTKDVLGYIKVDNLKNGKTYTIQWNVLNATQGSISWDKVQIEEGSSPTAYRSYVSPKLISVPLGDVRLRSTPDGTHDKFVRVNGVWNKEENVTYEVLNGSEGWSGWAEYPRFYIANAKFADVGTQSGVTSNKFKNRSYDGLYSSQGKMFCVSLSNGTTGGTHRLFVTLDSSVVTFASVAEFKTWLAANPTDICYHRATPIYTPITDYKLTNALDELENLILQNGYNNIVVETVNGVAPFIDLDYKAYKK